MDDYISREKTIKAFCEKCIGYLGGHCSYDGECSVDIIQNMPSAQDFSIAEETDRHLAIMA